MPIKLKLKAPSSEANTDDSNADGRATVNVPKIKIKPPSSGGQSKESLVLSIGKKKVKVGKEKANKIKLSLKNKGSAEPLDLGTQTTKLIPKVRVKPTRIPGEGYDSEAPDLEDDPLLEQGIIIRFLNDSKLDFVQNAVDSGDLTGINIKWVAKDKAVVNIMGSFYSARLVDLPTITELYKTVDKKNIFKTLDVCQMLLVLKEVVPSELSIDKDFEISTDNLYKHPLYNMTPKNELKPTRAVYRDGLTTPFEDVFRRFRPRKVNHRVSNDIDARINELIKLDNEAEETHFELVDLSKENNKFSSLSGTPSSASSPQFFNTVFDREEETTITNDDLIESDLEEELAKALANDEDIELEGAVEEVGEDQDQNMAIEEVVEAAGDDEEEDDDDDDEDEEDEDEDEEEGKADKQHVKMLEEEIADLEKVVEVHRRGLASATHKMMKMKFQTSYNTLKSSLDAKRREFSKMISDQQSNDKISSTLYTKPPSGEEGDDDADEVDEEDDDDEEEPDGNNNEVEDHQGNDGQDDDIDDLF